MPGPSDDALAGGDAIIHDYYSVPVWMMKGYLEQLGGREQAENEFLGDGWRASLSAAPWRQIGSLRVGGTRAQFDGPPEVLAALFARLHPLTLRGGG